MSQNKYFIYRPSRHIGKHPRKCNNRPFNANMIAQVLFIDKNTLLQNQINFKQNTWTFYELINWKFSIDGQKKDE